MKKIVVYGTRWCKDTILARKVLDDSNIEYDYVDINQDKKGEQFVKETNHGNRSVPTIVFSDNSILVEPTRNELLNKLEKLGAEN